MSLEHPATDQEAAILVNDSAVAQSLEWLLAAHRIQATVLSANSFRAAAMAAVLFIDHRVGKRSGLDLVGTLRTGGWRGLAVVLVGHHVSVNIPEAPDLIVLEKPFGGEEVAAVVRRMRALPT